MGLAKISWHEYVCNTRFTKFPVLHYKYSMLPSQLNFDSLQMQDFSGPLLMRTAANISCRLTWGIASLRQATDFTPGYIADWLCWEELLDLAGMMPSPTQ
jgi:hypothetical protein